MKEQTNHTPGPWTTFYEGRDNAHPCGWQDTEIGSLSALAVLRPQIAVLTCRDKREQNANARLIAAAPDLLAALKALSPMWDNDSPLLTVYAAEIESARAAIKRARGEG